MKRATLLLLGFLAILSCKQEKGEVDSPKEVPEVSKTTYPENMSKVFKAHGGIDAWNTFSGLYFEIEKPTFNERHTVALKSRKSVINAEHYMLGFDGSEVWLKEVDSIKFDRNPRFYYNLMFYFYAMPFILGDDGINYAEAPPLSKDGVEYQGILVTYDSGIGESPEDEYILYFEPETYKMVWLGYTVTYFSKEKSSEFHFIKYSDWQTVKGLQLPQTLQWYNYENDQPTTLRNSVNFVNVKLTESVPNDQIFAVVEGGKIIQ